MKTALTALAMVDLLVSLREYAAALDTRDENLHCAKRDRCRELFVRLLDSIAADRKRSSQN